MTPPPAADPPSDLSAEQTRLKLQGNASLHASDFPAAIAAYTAALALDPHRTLADSAALLANRALAHLKLSQPAPCADDCTAALQLNPAYAKALYRRAQAREALGALSDAFDDLRLLVRLEPANKEAAAAAARLKRRVQQQADASDLSSPKQAADALLSGAAGEARLRAVHKLSRIADDAGRARELLHAGAVDALLSLLPAAAEVKRAADVPMPLVGLALEALEKMAAADAPDVLRAVGAGAGGGEKDRAVDRIVKIAGVAANARAEAEAAAGGGGGGGGGGGEKAAEAAAAAAAEEEAEAVRVKNCVLTACRAVSLLARLAASVAAVRSQEAQGRLLLALLPLCTHAEEKVALAAQDGLLRVVNADRKAAMPVLPKLLSALIHLLGNEESSRHKLATAIITRVLAKEEKKGDKEDDADLTKALCAACETALSPILRSEDAEWEAYTAAIHGVTVILEANRDVGSWLLRQESIFWSLAEVADMDDEDLLTSLAAIYAHAANDPQHFRDSAGDEPLKHLKAMLKSTKPRVRCRACVALAKVSLLHQNHRVTINPTGKLLSATLGLLEAKAPPSVHRWAVDALMFLTVMPDVKEHLLSKRIKFGSLVALAESAGKDSSFHFSIIQTFRRLCVPREKPEDQKKLEREMDKAQIEQMRQLAAGGAGAAPSEKEDDPAQLRQLAEQLAADDAALVVSEVVAHAKSESLRRPAAQILQAMAEVVDCRGKLVQQGGFKAMLALSVDEDEVTRTAAAWGLAKVGISINPVLYPQRTGSGPEGMIAPILKLIDGADNELQQFEGSMALCNLATVPHLRDKIIALNGWRTLQMTLASDNPQVQRAALECMSNLVMHDAIAEKFTSKDSTDVKIFVSFCASDDPKAQIAASGALATLADIPEIGAAIIGAKGLEPLTEIALLSEEPALLHRAAVALKGLLASCCDLVVGKEGAEPPEHAMLTLGALTLLSRDARCEPARRAAVEALVALQRDRADVVLPPPEAVAHVVASMREDAARREAEAAAAQEAGMEAVAEEEGEGGQDEGIEEIVVDERDEEGTIL